MRITAPSAQAILEFDGAGQGLFDCPELLDRATAFVGGARDRRFVNCKEWAAVVGPKEEE